MIDTLDLKDSFRQLHPNQLEFTYFRNDCHSHLDRFYTSIQIQNQIGYIEHIPNFGTDHKFRVKITVANPSAIETSKDIWQMNNILLEDRKFIEALRSYINSGILVAKDIDPVKK